MADKITLDKLRALKEDWDNDGAPAISEDAIALAEVILNTPGQAVPTRQGGVQIEWYVGSSEVAIVITPEGTIELE